MPKPNDGRERETEDDKARRSLGGVKGSRRLAPAPLVPREREQEPIKDNPQHVGVGKSGGKVGPGLRKAGHDDGTKSKEQT
jgi:hypothetical protein